MDAISGGIEWRHGLETDDQDDIGRPTIHDGTVYHGEYGNVFALDADSGTEKWRRSDVPSLETERVGANDDGVYLSCWGDGDVLRLNPDDGTTIWKASVADSASSGPVVSTNDEGLVYTTGRSQTYASSRASGQVKWGVGVMPSSHGLGWTYHAGTLYVAGRNQSDKRVLTSVDAATGLTNWTLDAPSQIEETKWGVPSVHDGTVLVPDKNEETSLLAYGGVATEPKTTTTTETTTTASTTAEPTTAEQTTTDSDAGTTDDGGVDETATNSTATADEETTSAADTTSTTSPEDSDDSDDEDDSNAENGPMPGFGVGSALAALAAGAGVLQRRAGDDE